MILIAGPCVIESQDQALFLAEAILPRALALGYDFYFKASFDKANRTSGTAYRGPGLEAGLETLEAVKAKTGAKVTTDIHEARQAGPVGEVVDLIQIPALLSRQTDLIHAAALTGKPINIKKGQFMAPADMKQAALKATIAGAKTIFLTERGSCFGYHDLVVDMRSIPIMKGLGNYKVIIDASHSVQRPTALGGASSGQPEFIGTIAMAAVAAGADGIFVEVHERPTAALSDGMNSLPLELLPRLLRLAKMVEVGREWK